MSMELRLLTIPWQKWPYPGMCGDFEKIIDFDGAACTIEGYGNLLGEKNYNPSKAGEADIFPESSPIFWAWNRGAQLVFSPEFLAT